MSEPLSPSDLSAIQSERGSVHMHVGGVLVFEGGIDHRTVRERVADRLPLVPQYRRKLQEGALEVTHPVWVEDEDFDLDHHVRELDAPSPGEDAELCDLVGELMSEPLDRDRPLWRLFVVQGLADGRTALVAKIHHALVDGAAAIDLSTVVLDAGPDQEDLEAPEEEEEDEEDDSGQKARIEQLARLAATAVDTPRRLARAALERTVTTDPEEIAERAEDAVESLEEMAKARPRAPDTRLNFEIGEERRFALGRARFDDVKAVGSAADATINDVLLAAVALMLSDYLDDPELEHVVALVPVAVGDDSDDENGGNRIATVFVDLPLRGDPLERVQAVSDAMEEAKGSAQVQAGVLMVGAIGLAPPLVSSLAVRAMSGLRVFNLVASNIPGPERELSLADVPLGEVFPAIPLNPSNQGLSIGMLSYEGTLYLGVLADREGLPDVGEAAAGLERALDSLSEAASEAGD